MPRQSQSYNRGANAEVIIPGERPDPPPELREIEAAVWRKIVGRLPADWIAADNEPLLKELCRHVIHADELSARLQATREMIAELREQIRTGNVIDVQTLKAREFLIELGKSEMSLLRAHGYQSERIGNLATKLRLTNQAQEQPKKAGTRRDVVPPGKKPWEGWEADDDGDDDRKAN